MNRFNLRLDSIYPDVHMCVVSIQAKAFPSACIDSNGRWVRIRKPPPGDSHMESLILASYVLKSNHGKPETHPAFDEFAQQSARSALASIAASMVGMAAFVLVLSFLG